MAPTLQISIDRVNRPCYLVVWLGCPKPPHCARVAYSRRQLCMELSTFFPAQKEKNPANGIRQCSQSVSGDTRDDENRTLPFI